MHWNKNSAPAVNARQALPALVSDYFAEVRKALKKDGQPEKLHKLRLATKRLRYSLEIFRPCYGPGLETRIATLRTLQSLLGDVNDGVAGGRLLTKAMKASGTRKEAIKYLHKRAEEKASEFRDHWEKVFDAPGRERWWTGYLSHEARALGVRNVTRTK